MVPQKNSSEVLSSLKKIREICCSYDEDTGNPIFWNFETHLLFKHEIIQKINVKHDLLNLVVQGLNDYMANHLRQKIFHYEVLKSANAENYFPFGLTRKNHFRQIQERLNFIQFILKYISLHTFQKFKFYS